VVLGEGTHQVRLSFEPRGLRAGAWLAGAGLLALGVMLLARRQDALGGAGGPESPPASKSGAGFTPAPRKI